MSTPAPWLVGLDVGQVTDPAAVAIAERKLVLWGNELMTCYDVRYLQRFPLTTPYVGLCLHGHRTAYRCADCPDGRSMGGVVEQTLTLLGKLPVPRGWDGGVTQRPYRFIFDMTGVGRGVYDAFKALGEWPIAVTMTHGQQQVQHDHKTYTVPKQRLVSDLVVTMQSGRLKVAHQLAEAPTLLREITEFQYRIHPQTLQDSYGAWREGAHDDLLFAVGLIAWYGENHRLPRPPLGTPAPQAEGPAMPLDRLRAQRVAAWR